MFIYLKDKYITETKNIKGYSQNSELFNFKYIKFMKEMKEGLT